ncbi:alginate export family protein [Hymenobacter lapidiphilus]|uniref:Alginate export family protein n=1 Tax=Hymenobacter lapidiphilus TaxID=2608003 RepID=A0A7Y7U691_9BACT|nr:alginate export family protein [Hymenobacter lapidiphilus]NVO32263.1 alginate export family protein [Hymenobacter lapidiphilus]
MSSSTGPAFAQGLNPLVATKGPAYSYLRHEQSYGYLQDPTVQLDYSDRLKYRPLGVHRGAYLSVGGDSRQILERFRYEGWSAEVGRPYVLSLNQLFADLEATPRLRLYTEIGNAWAARQGGPRFIDQDKLYIFQGFADLRALPDSGLILRVGRQVLDYGTGLMVSVQGGPNLRQVHDGVSAHTAWGRAKLHAFFSRPVLNQPGVFDNRLFTSSTRLWGTYNEYALKLLPTSHLDAYYVGYTRRQAMYQAGTADEARHAVGARLTGQRDTWGFDLESAYQWGKFGNQRVSAWMAGSILYRNFTALHPMPTLGINFLYLSGDARVGDGRLNTFQAPFQKIFVGAGIPAGGNMVTVQPVASVAFSPRLKIFADYQFLWRASRRDGLYGPYHLFLRPVEVDRSARYLGTQLNMEVHWYASRHWNAYAKYAKFRTDGLLAELPGVRDGMYFFRAFVTYSL